MKHIIILVLLSVFTLILAGCGRVVSSGNYTLESDKTVRGDLTVLSGNIKLEEGSRVTGKIFMMSGNLTVHGEVEGNIVLASGNVVLGEEAFVGGDIVAASGNVNRAEGARIEGDVLIDPARFLFSSGLAIGVVGAICLMPLALFVIPIALIVILFRRRSNRVSPPVELPPVTPPT